MNKLLLLLLLTISFSSTFASQHQYEDLIHEALLRRNSYYSDVIPINNRVKAYQNPDTWIQSIRPIRSQWYYFLRGVNDLRKGKSSSENFHKAIIEANYNPGNLWALFIEFELINQREWSNDVVEKMHKALITSGSTEAPTIVNQLLILARQSSAKGDKGKASYYIQTALKFTDTTSPIIASALLNGLDGGETKITFVTLISTYLNELKENWFIQTHLYNGLFIFIRGFIYVSTMIMFILLFIKYYPKVIHTLACKYPLSVPYKLRITFISILLIPLFYFGRYITVLTIAFALFIYIDSKTYKRLITLVLIGLFLFPLLTFPEAILQKTTNKNAIHNLYYQAVNEIPSLALENAIKNWHDPISPETPKNNTQKALLFTAEAIINLKQQNLADAQFYIDKAISLKPNLQPVLITSSVINAINNNDDKANELFDQTLKRYPKLATVHFNYNRWMLETKIIEHNDTHLKKATELDEEKIRTFVDLNSLYYGLKKTPTTRRYFISTMDAKTFWKNRKSLIGSTNESAKKLWGNTFLGLSPLQTVSSLAFIFVVILIRLISTSSKRASISKCTLCGRPTCKHCKCAEYCNECNTLMKSISNESLIESMKIKISINKRLTTRILGISFQMLFPGSAAFFINSKPPLRAFPLLIITMLVYTTYSVLFSYRFSLFPETSLTIKLVILGILSFYNIFFILKFFSSLKYEKSAGKA